MKRKILSLILVFAMTVSLLTVGTGAVEPTYGDTAGHWAESSIERWSSHGIIQGSNGQFDPNGQLTCAQLATILAKLLKLPAAKDAGFTDNTADAWYFDAINRCAAAGILNGNGDGTVTPEAPITRERAMVMLARALGIEPIRKPDLTKYTDAAQVSAYAQGYVAALIEAGIVGGVTADELAPQDNINRASTVTILDRAISTYADKAGATVKADGKGLVLVVAENVKITGAPEGTKIVVADGATGLTVNGKSVSDDQTYIVPKTEPAKPSSGSSGGYSHSHSYVYTDNGDGTHTGKCYANDSTLAPAAHNIVDGKCTVCGAELTDAAVASVSTGSGYSYYNSLAKAITEAADGATVTLIGNAGLNADVSISNKITLDLNGKTIETKGNTISIAATGDLTVTGNGKINNDVLATGSKENNDADYKMMLHVAESGKLTIENGTFATKASQVILTGGTTTIKGGTFQSTATVDDFENASVIYSTAMINVAGTSASLTMTDGTINAGGHEEQKDGLYGIYVQDGGNVVLGDEEAKTGPTIDAYCAAIGENNTTSPANITVYGGEYTTRITPTDGAKWSYFCATIYASASGNITISGGTFNGYYGISSRYVKVAQNLNISGGIFNGTKAALFVDNVEGSAKNGDRTISITGGTFSSNPSAYLAEGYITLVNGGTFTVSDTDEIPVTTATVQGYLDSKYGPINGKTLVLSAGEYDTLYFRQSTESQPFVSGATGGSSNHVDAEKVTYDYHPGRTDVTYMRTFENITIAGGENVIVKDIVFMDGSYKYAEDTEGALSGNTIYSEANTAENHGQDTDWHNRLISFFTIKNLIFKDITFKGATTALKMGYHSNDAGLEEFTYRYTVDGLHFDSCEMNVSEHEGSDIMLLHIARDSGQTTRYKNVSVENCIIKADRVLVVDGIENLTITGNTFTNIKNRDLNFSQGGNLQTVTGNVLISGNTSTGSTERFVRIGAASDMNLTITDNTISDYKGTDNDYIKVTGNPLSYTISGNTATAEDTSKTLTINVNNQTVTQA